MTLIENKTKTFKIESMFSFRKLIVGVSLDKVEFSNADYQFFAIHLVWWTVIFEWEWCNKASIAAKPILQ